MSTEKAAWNWLRKGALGNDDIHLQRIENCLARGTPDVEGCIKGVQFWLELKAGPLPAKETSKVDCEPLKSAQQRFIKARLAAGGNAWILYRVDREVYLIHGSDAEVVTPQPRLFELKNLSYCGSKATPLGILKRIQRNFPEDHINTKRFQ